MAKRQVEQLAANAAADVGNFYDARAPEPGASDDVLVISVDGKGIVMRPDSLRPATEKAAAAATNKLQTRLSKGEKRDRKRMAEVGAVYDLAPVPRSPADVLASKSAAAAAPAPRGPSGLPRTGGDLGGVGSWGMGAVVVGAVLVVLARRTVKRRFDESILPHLRRR